MTLVRVVREDSLYYTYYYVYSPLLLSELMSLLEDGVDNVIGDFIALRNRLSPQRRREINNAVMSYMSRNIIDVDICAITRCSDDECLYYHHGILSHLYVLLKCDIPRTVVYYNDELLCNGDYAVCRRNRVDNLFAIRFSRQH